MANRSGIIVYYKDKFLLVQTEHNDKQIWGFPKGRLKGDDKKVSAEREFLEETGVCIKLDKCRQLRVLNVLYFIHEVDSMFHVSYDDVPDKNEIKNVQWFSIDELQDSKVPMNRSLRHFMKNDLHKLYNLGKVTK